MARSGRAKVGNRVRVATPRGPLPIVAGVSKPYWSDGMKAFIMEFREADAAMFGGAWESRIYASSEGDIKHLYAAVKKVTTRSGWLRETAAVARKVPRQGPGWFLYRVSVGQYAETFNVVS